MRNAGRAGDALGHGQRVGARVRPDDDVRALDLDHPTRLFDRNRGIGIGVANHEFHGLTKDAPGCVDVLDRQQEPITHLDADFGQAAGEVAEERDLQWTRFTALLNRLVCALSRSLGLGLLRFTLGTTSNQ